MPGTLVPSQNFDHLLEVVSGKDGMHDLQFVAAPGTGEAFVKGSLVYVDPTTGTLKAGGGATYMPMWAITGVNDFDANGDVGNMAGGHVSAYVATGGYEIFTTEFVAGVYAPNDLLTYATGDDAGKVKKSAALYSAAAVVGVVSSGTATEMYNQSVLYFWPCFQPAVKLS